MTKCKASSGGFNFLTTVRGSGRVPHVRATCPGVPWGVHEPKTDSSNALTPWATVRGFGRTVSPSIKTALVFRQSFDYDKSSINSGFPGEKNIYEKQRNRPSAA